MRQACRLTDRITFDANDRPRMAHWDAGVELVNTDPDMDEGEFFPVPTPYTTVKPYAHDFSQDYIGTPDIGAYEYDATNTREYWIPGYRHKSKASYPFPLGTTTALPSADLMWLQARSPLRLSFAIRCIWEPMRII